MNNNTPPQTNAAGSFILSCFMNVAEEPLKSNKNNIRERIALLALNDRDVQLSLKKRARNHAQDNGAAISIRGCYSIPQCKQLSRCR